MISSRWTSALLLSVSLFAVPNSANAEFYPQITVNIVEQTNFSKSQKAKLARISTLFEMVVNSEEFRNRVVNFSTRTKTNGRVVETQKFVQNQGLTNEEILKRMYEGTEDFKYERQYNPPPGNNMADFFLRLYRGKNGIVGYTNKGRRRINLNTIYFNNYSTSYLAGNLVHEWMHKLGFSHDFKRTDRRPYSVPYGIGGIVRDLGKKITTAQGGETELEPQEVELL